MILRIGPDGKITAVAHGVRDRHFLEALGEVVEVRRAGRVLPARRLPRLAFRVIRRLVPDDHPLAAWTRRWPGPWIVDLRGMGGPILGPYAGRSEAMAAEEQWVAARLEGTPCKT